MQEKIFCLPNWARTALGTPLSLYGKSHSSTLAGPYIFIGGVHGDEPEGVRLAQDFLQWLMQEEDKGTDLHDWLLIPCLNPDGFQKNERTNSRGVDLNRNFPSFDWTSENTKGSRYNPGPFPGSELEVQALVKLIESEKPQLIVHFHSWEPCVVYTGSPGKRYADVLASDSGYPAREDIGYPTPGSLGQYGWQNHYVPVVCIEEQEKIDLDLVWPHFKNGLQKLMLKEQI